MDEVAYRRRWRVLAAVMLGAVMGPLDASIVYIALPVIAGAFAVDPATVGWVSLAYLLVLGSFLLPLGRLGDMYGFKGLFLAGQLLFVAASALCGLAPSLGELIACRAVQAAGAGLTMAMSPAIITATFPAQERGRALGINAMAVATGLALGPGLGGLLVDVLGWRAIFFVNVPLGLAAHWWCRRVVPSGGPARRQRFDWAGAVLAFVGLGSLLLFASRGGAYGWRGPVWLLGAAAVGGLGGLLVAERRVPEPMLDLTLFRSRVFAAGNGAALLNFMTQYVIVFVTPFYLQQVLAYSAARAGAAMTAFPLTVLVVAPLAGMLSDKLGQRWLAFAGSLLCTVAALALHSLVAQTGMLDLMWRLSLFGLGTGLFQSPNNSAIMGSVPWARLGIAGGMLATTRNVGMALGMALAGVVLARGQTAHLDRLTASGAYLAAMQDAYLVAAALSLLATVVCLCTSAGKARTAPSGGAA